MTWMNRWEIDRLVNLLEAEDRGTVPNALRGARILQRLMRWTDNNSDGWSSWAKPGNAARTLMVNLKVVEDSLYGEATDLTTVALNRGITPIKAFLTRQKVDHAPILDEPDRENQHILSVVLVQSEIDALLTLSSNAGLSPSAWIARQITTAVA